MVGRHNSFSVTKRSLRNAETTAGKRPRRVVQSKLVDDTVGLSRQEEQELNKALYASLQENRRSKSLPGNVGHDSSSSSTTNGGAHSSSNGGAHSSSKSSSIASSSRSLSRSLKSNKRSLGHRQSLRTSPILNKYHLRQSAILASRAQKSKTSSPSVPQSRASTSSTSTTNINLDESSQDSVRSSTSSANGSKRKIHAQRKFAQGCSLPGTPSCTPVKSATPPTKMMSFRIPKTEDFLTFLCLRGSSVLPPHLDFFNYSREEMASRDEAQRLGPTATAKGKQQRESTPDNSSTSSSGANEEVAEAAQVATPSPSSRGGNSFLARRSAARASAGTPETARGIVSLRQGLQHKVSTSSSSSSLACFPVSSPSPTLTISRLTNSTTAPVYSNKFYFTPEKPLSPSKASGIRPGEFTPPPFFSSTRSEASHLNKPYTFSPLVRSSSSSKLSSRHSRSDSQASRGSYSSLSSSASMEKSPEALLRKLKTPGLSAKDSTLKVKVTPLCTSASLSSFHVDHCHRLEPQECLPPSTKCSSPSLLSKSSSSSFTKLSSVSSQSLAFSFSGRPAKVNKSNTLFSQPETLMSSPEFAKYPRLISTCPSSTNKQDINTHKLCPLRKFSKNRVFPCHSSKAVKHRSSDFEHKKQRTNLSASRCCFQSNQHNTNPSNTKLNINTTNTSCHGLKQSSCSLHDTSYPESCAFLSCACSHNRSSQLHVCSCSLPPKCACKRSNSEIPSIHQFHQHHNHFASHSTHPTLQAFRCVDISQDALCLNHLKDCACRHGAQHKACDSNAEFAPSTSEPVLHGECSTVQDESAQCCHDSNNVQSESCQQDATKTYNRAEHCFSSRIEDDTNHVNFSNRFTKAYKVGPRKHVWGYSVDTNFQSNATNNQDDANTVSNANDESVFHSLKGSNMRNGWLSTTRPHPYSEGERNVSDGPLGYELMGQNGNKYRKQIRQNKNTWARHCFEHQNKLSAFRHKTVRDCEQVSPCQSSDLSDVSTSGLTRSSEQYIARQRWVRKHFNCGDLVSERSHLSDLAKKSKLKPWSLIQSRKMSKKACRHPDFQKEFVKMLDGKGFGNKTQKHQGVADSKKVISDSVPLTYDSDWSVFDQQISEVISAKDKTNFCSQSKNKNALEATIESPDSNQVFRAQPELLTMVSELPVSPKLSKKLNHPKKPDISKRSSVNLHSPSDEILMLRDQVISAFQKFNSKDVIASSIQAAKAVEISNVDPSAAVDQVSSSAEVTLASEPQVLPGTPKHVLQKGEDCGMFNRGIPLSAEIRCHFAANEQSQGLKDIGLANDKQQTDDDIVAESADYYTESKLGSQEGTITKYSDLKTTRSSLDYASFNQDKLLLENSDKEGINTCTPEAAMALIRWKVFDNGITERRNKQIQTNLCAAVGHCSLSQISFCSETLSIGAPKVEPGCEKTTDVKDYCLYQNELKKHSAELQRWMPDMKLSSQQLTSSKDCIDKKDYFDSTVFDKLSLTSGKDGGMFQVVHSVQPLIKGGKSEFNFSFSQKDLISGPDLSLVERFDSFPPVSKESNIKNQVKVNSSKVTLPQSNQTKSATNHSLGKGEKYLNNSHLMHNGRDHLSVIRSISNEALPKKLSADESHLDFAIDLSMKQRDSNPICSTNSEDQCAQITAENQFNVTSASTCKKVVTFDLSEIFEWSIPNNVGKPKLVRAKEDDGQGSYCADKDLSIDVGRPDLTLQEIHLVDRVKECLSETQNGLATSASHKMRHTRSGFNVVDGGSLEVESQSNLDSKQFSRNNILQVNSSKTVRPVTSKDFLEKTRKNDVNSKKCHVEPNVDTNSRREITDHLISNFSREREDISTDAIKKQQDRQFTNQDLNRIIESVASTSNTNKFKRSNFDSPKEGSTRFRKHLVKSRSLDDGAYVGLMTWCKPRNEASITLHSYGSLNTGQGFALVNGQLQQCRILNKRKLLADSIHRNNLLPESSFCSLHVTGSNYVNIQPKVNVSQQLTTTTNTGDLTYSDAITDHGKNLVNTATSCNVNNVGSKRNISSSVNGSIAVKRKSLSTVSCARKKIHSLGKSIYLHHNSSASVDRKQNAEHQNQQEHNVPTTSSQQAYSNQLCGLILSVNTTSSQINEHSTKMDNSDISVIEFENRKNKGEKRKMEDMGVETSQSGTVDDVIIIENESKKCLKGAKLLQLDVSGAACNNVSHPNSQCTAPFSNPSSMDVISTCSGVSLLSDEPIDLHVSMIAPTKAYQASETIQPSERLVSAQSLDCSKHLSRNNNEKVNEDLLSLLEILNNKDGHYQKVSEFSGKTFMDIQYHLEKRANQKSNPSISKKLDNNSVCFSNQLANQNISAAGYSTDALNMLPRDTLHLPTLSEEVSTDSDVSHMSLLEPDLCLPDSFGLSQSLTNVQASDENILEALMEELQVQISILKDEINQGNKEFLDNAHHPGVSLSLLHDLKNSEPSVIYSASGRHIEDGTWSPTASHSPLDLSETIKNSSIQNAPKLSPVDILEISSDTDD